MDREILQRVLMEKMNLTDWPGSRLKNSFLTRTWYSRLLFKKVSAQKEGSSLTLKYQVRKSALVFLFILEIFRIGAWKRWVLFKVQEFILYLKKTYLFPLLF